MRTDKEVNKTFIRGCLGAFIAAALIGASELSALSAAMSVPQGENLGAGIAPAWSSLVLSLSENARVFRGLDLNDSANLGAFLQILQRSGLNPETVLQASDPVKWRELLQEAVSVFAATVTEEATRRLTHAAPWPAASLSEMRALAIDLSNLERIQEILPDEALRAKIAQCRMGIQRRLDRPRILKDTPALEKAVSIREAFKARLPKDSLPVPMSPQQTDYSCGAATLRAAFMYWGVYDGPEENLYPLLGTTPEDGTEPRKIVDMAQRNGLRAQLKKDRTLSDLRTALGRGETVIVNFQAWRDRKEARVPWSAIWENGHYALLVGMDTHYAYLMDPAEEANSKYVYLPLDELLDRWHDYRNRGGHKRIYNRLAIFIKGKNPIKTSVRTRLIRAK